MSDRGQASITTSFTSDRAATATRIAELQEYMARHVLDGDDFVCSSQGDCRASVGTDCSFSEGHLSHVGRNFDVSDGSGRPRRVVVMGRQASARGVPHTDMPARSRAIHDDGGLRRRMSSDGEHERRNPHLRGTTLALQVLFDLPTSGLHADEFVDLPGGKAHVFDCCAILNRTLCSSHRIGGSSGRPSSTMVRNCERHLAASLEILEPTIVILQGADVWRWSAATLRPRTVISDHLVRCDLGSSVALVCMFMHPSSWGTTRWDLPGSPYFLDVVEPTLQRAIDFL